MSKPKTIMIDDVEYVRKQDVQNVPLSIKENYVIVRTYSAGVFAGNLKSRNGKETVLTNARRLWYWDGASSLSQLAQEGTVAPQNCKFPCEVSEILLTETIEILNCTEKSYESIKSVKVWKR